MATSCPTWATSRLAGSGPRPRAVGSRNPYWTERGVVGLIRDASVWPLGMSSEAARAETW